MTILGHNLGQNSPQAQVSRGVLGERVRETKREIDGVLKKIREQREALSKKKKEIIEKAIAMCEKSNLWYISLFARLLEDTGDINTKDNAGESLLSYAARSIDTTIIVKLILEHPDILVNEKEDANGWTALMQAVTDGNTGVAKLLLTHPDIRINEKAHNNDTVFTLSVREGNTEILDLLLTHPDVPVNEKNDIGQTVLTWSVGSNKDITMKILNCVYLDLEQHDQGKEALTIVQDEEIRTLLITKMQEQGIEF